MKRQVNLYLEQFRQQPERLTAQHMLLSLGAALGLMFLIIAINGYQLYATNKQVHEAEAAQSTALNQLQDLRTHTVFKPVDARLAAEVEKLETVVTYRTRLQDVLQHDMFESGSGYSHYFIALARQHVPGMWLTGISIVGAGRAVTLQGRTNASPLVPQYLQGLSREPMLQGTEFKVFQIKKPEPDPEKKQTDPWLQFVVSTQDNAVVAQP